VSVVETIKKKAKKVENQSLVPQEILENAFRLMSMAKAMTEIYEANFKFVSKYVHATSRGHEAIQLAMGLQLNAQDFAYPYYRDDSMLLGMGLRPFDLMLQLMAKRDDPFSGGRSYYCHPSLRDARFPKIPHQSSATGMQAIPATGAALGLWYHEKMGSKAFGSEHVNNTEEIQVDLENPYPYHFRGANGKGAAPVVVCSLGDASVTEGEIAEAFQMAVLKQLPILYLVQDNGWDISANAAETRVADAATYAKGFPGLEAISIEGNDFEKCWLTVQEVLGKIRRERRPFLLHARVPLLNHHTSGVRKEWYRDDLEEHQSRDPYPILRQCLMENGFSETQLQTIEKEAVAVVASDFSKAQQAEDPRPEDLFTHDYAPSPVTEELGERCPAGAEAKVMVDSALFAVEELMKKHPECLLYGQDVGKRLGGVFREAATLADKFGDSRVFNTPYSGSFYCGQHRRHERRGLAPHR
jgi:2-oxoisovalerate dehydrogenase E1 component